MARVARAARLAEERGAAKAFPVLTTVVDRAVVAVKARLALRNGPTGIRAAAGHCHIAGITLLTGVDVAVAAHAERPVGVREVEDCE